MRTRQFIFDSLRSHIKARHLTYRHIAQDLGVSETTVKRLFLQQDCTLERLEEICELLQIDLRELIKSSPRPRKFIQQLNRQQEELLAQNHKLLMVAVCAMSLWTFDDMAQHLHIPNTETEGLLRQLDKMGFLDLMPRNRYRLRVAREFSWIVDGPIMRMVKSMAGDYFNHLFEGEGEILKIINVRISRHAAHRLRTRLEQITQEYADQVAIDANLPLHERPPLSICIAARRWVPEQMQALMGPR
jgi:DNA-binding Xre family transcriptional regulator